MVLGWVGNKKSSRLCLHKSPTFRGSSYSKKNKIFDSVNMSIQELLKNSHFDE